MNPKAPAETTEDTRADAPVIKPFSWYVGIPICTNPSIALDVVTLALALLVGGTLFVIFGQATIGGGVTPQAATAACYIGLYLALSALAAYLFVGGFLFGNRYAALYRIDAHGVYCEYIRGDIQPVNKVSLPTTGFAIIPVHAPHHTVEKRIPWEMIYSVHAVNTRNVLTLKGRRGTLTKMYCPDEAVMHTAQRMIESMLVPKNT